MSGDIELSIVIPVYNSAEILQELHKRLTTSLKTISLKYEIIMINDYSPDNSWQKLESIAVEDSHIKAVNLRKNVGYDNAVMAGLSLVSGRKYVITMDDDLQHAPEDIPELINMAEKNHDVVYANFSNREYSLFKRIGSWGNDKLAQIIIHKPTHIYLSPFKILRREVVDEIVKYSGPFPYVDGLIFQVTSSISQIAVQHNKRVSGEGGHDLYRSLRIVFNFCTMFSILPLRVSSMMGLVISVLSGLYCFGLVLWKVFGGQAPEGWATIVGGIALMGGIQLMSLGVLGEYVGRSYMNANRRPQFVIKEIVTAHEQ